MAEVAAKKAEEEAKALEAQLADAEAVGDGEEIEKLKADQVRLNGAREAQAEAKVEGTFCDCVAFTVLSRAMPSPNVSHHAATWLGL